MHGSFIHECMHSSVVSDKYFCSVQVSMMGSLEHIQSCHTEAHSLLFGTDIINKQRLKVIRY